MNMCTPLCVCVHANVCGLECVSVCVCVCTCMCAFAWVETERGRGRGGGANEEGMWKREWGMRCWRDQEML